MSVDPAWLLLLLGGALTAGLAAAASWLRKIHGPEPVPPDRCLLCTAVVTGLRRCSQCGFDPVHARRAFPSHYAMLRALQDAHDRLARDRRWYQAASPCGAFEEVDEIPRPELGASIRDVLYSAPTFLGTPRGPDDAALLRDIDDLLNDHAATIDPFTGAYEADRERALALLDARERTLTRLAHALAVRLASALHAAS